MNQTHVLLVLIAAILTLAIRPRLLPLVAVAALALYAPVAIGRAQTWNLFHYWVGAKYFSELGYHQLYNCAYDAAPHLWDDTARDLATYQIVAIQSLPQCRAEFTAERWQQFIQDLEWLYTIGNPIQFPNAIRDKGLNTSPTWLAVAIPLAQAPAGSPAWWLVVYADTIMLLAALAATWQLRGSHRASLATISLVTFDGTLGQLMGHWLQYPWLAILLFSWLAWGQGRRGLAGAGIALATSLRVFPGVLFIWPLIHWRLSGWRFWVGAAVAGLAAVMVGSLTPAGLDVWPQFAHKMALHSSYIAREPGNYGLRQQVMVIANPDGAIDEWYAFAAGDPPPPPEHLSPSAWSWIAALTIGSLAILAIHHRQNLHFGDGLLLLYPLLVLSRYYYSWLIFNILEADDKEALLILSMYLLTFSVTYWGHPLFGYTIMQYGLLLYVWLKSVSVLSTRREAWNF